MKALQLMPLYIYNSKKENYQGKNTAVSSRLASKANLSCIEKTNLSF